MSDQVDGLIMTGAMDVPSEALQDVAVIRLNDPELAARLDRVFASHFANRRSPTLRVRCNQALKRLTDIVCASIGLVLAAPLIGLAALGTLADTGLPVFYSQVRRIRFGRQARIYKMRTLVTGADRCLGKLVSIKQNGRYLNIAKDESSYTRVGRVLEHLWIVELPQLWSVLRGEMSLVGNRPLPDYVINALGAEGELLERFSSPQGLTGYVQIIGRDYVTDEERTALEVLYSRVYDEGDVFLEDLRIVWLTVLAYLGVGGRRTAQFFLRSDA